jgi:hypothetical protein
MKSRKQVVAEHLSHINGERVCHVTYFVVQDGAAGQPGGHCLPGNRGEVPPSSG